MLRNSRAALKDGGGPRPPMLPGGSGDARAGGASLDPLLGAMIHRMGLLRTLPLLLLLACAAGGAEEDTPAPARGPATLQVENHNFLDMTVYVVNGARQRLGVARGNATTSLTIPERLVRGGASPLRFLCDPIGGQGLPVTEEIVVEPGDTVGLTIPS
jgi:hypothetical protein